MEEFETQALNMGHSILKIDGQYIESQTVILHNGYLMGQQSRDEKIKKMREALELICAFRSESKLTILPIIRIETILRIAEKTLKEIT